MCSPTIESRSNTKKNIAYLNSPSSVVPNNDVANSQHKIQTYEFASPIMWNSILTFNIHLKPLFQVTEKSYETSIM